MLYVCVYVHMPGISSTSYLKILKLLAQVYTGRIHICVGAWVHAYMYVCVCVSLCARVPLRLLTLNRALINNS